MVLNLDPGPKMSGFENFKFRSRFFCVCGPGVARSESDPVRTGFFDTPKLILGNFSQKMPMVFLIKDFINSSRSCMLALSCIYFYCNALAPFCISVTHYIMGNTHYIMNRCKYFSYLLVNNRDIIDLILAVVLL